MRPACRFAAGALFGAATAATLALPLTRIIRGRLEPALAGLLASDVHVGAVEVNLRGTLRLVDVRVGTWARLSELDATRSWIALDGLHIGDGATPATLTEVMGLAPRLASLARRLGGPVAAIREGHPAGKRARVRVEGGDFHLAGVIAGQELRLDASDVQAEPTDQGEHVRAASARLSGPYSLVCDAPAFSADVEDLGQAFRVALAGATVSTRSGALLRDAAVYAELGSSSRPFGIGALRVAGSSADGGPVTVEVHAAETGQALQIEMHAPSLPLAPVAPALPHWLDASTAVLRVDAGGTLGASDVRYRVAMTLEGGTVDSRLIAPSPVVNPGATVTVQGAAARLPDGAIRLTLDSFAVSRGAIDVTGRLQIDRSAARFAISGRAALARAGCAAVLSSVPGGLIPDLAGLALAGTVAGDVRFSADSADPAGLELDTALQDDCVVLHDAPAADVAGLATRRVAELEASDGHGGRRLVDIGTGAAGWVPVSALPAAVPAAFVAAEDGSFYDHHGFDVPQIRRALSESIASRRLFRGASTITQQLARNLYLTPERSLSRKLEEAVLTWRLEHAMTKRQILECYLNVIELGDHVYGIAAAAHRWFGVSATALDARQAAFLASLAPAPRFFARRIVTDGPDASLVARVHAVLTKMYEAGRLPSAEYRAARRERIALRRQP